MVSFPHLSTWHFRPLVVKQLQTPHLLSTFSYQHSQHCHHYPLQQWKPSCPSSRYVRQLVHSAPVCFVFHFCFPHLDAVPLYPSPAQCWASVPPQPIRILSQPCFLFLRPRSYPLGHPAVPCQPLEQVAQRRFLEETLSSLVRPYLHLPASDI